MFAPMSFSFAITVSSEPERFASNQRCDGCAASSGDSVSALCQPTLFPSHSLMASFDVCESCRIQPGEGAVQ